MKKILLAGIIMLAVCLSGCSGSTNSSEKASTGTKKSASGLTGSNKKAVDAVLAFEKSTGKAYNKSNVLICKTSGGDNSISKKSFEIIFLNSVVIKSSSVKNDEGEPYAYCNGRIYSVNACQQTVNDINSAIIDDGADAVKNFSSAELMEYDICATWSDYVLYGSNSGDVIVKYSDIEDYV